jgi:hypothetical protein
MSTTFNKTNVTKKLTEALTAIAEDTLNIKDEVDEEGEMVEADPDHVELLNKLITAAVSAMMKFKPMAFAVTKRRTTSSSSSGKKRKGNSYSQFYKKVSSVLKGNDSYDEEMNFIERTSTSKSEKTLAIYEFINENKEEFAEFKATNLKELLDFLTEKLPKETTPMQKTSVAWTLYTTDEQRNSFKPSADEDD